MPGTELVEAGAVDDPVTLADPRPLGRVKDADVLARFHLEMLGEPCMVCELRPGRRAHHVKFRSRGGSDEVYDERGRRQLLWVCEICDSAHGDLPSISRYN